MALAWACTAGWWSSRSRCCTGSGGCGSAGRSAATSTRPSSAWPAPSSAGGGWPAPHFEEFSDVVSLPLLLAGGAPAHAPRLQVLQRHPQALTARPGRRAGAQLHRDVIGVVEDRAPIHQVAAELPVVVALDLDARAGRGKARRVQRPGHRAREAPCTIALRRSNEA